MQGLVTGVGKSHWAWKGKRSSQPSGVWQRHHLEGGRKTGSSLLLLLENGRRERMSVHEQGERSGESLWMGCGPVWRWCSDLLSGAGQVHTPSTFSLHGSVLHRSGCLLWKWCVNSEAVKFITVLNLNGAVVMLLSYSFSNWNNCWLYVKVHCIACNIWIAFEQ